MGNVSCNIISVSYDVRYVKLTWLVNGFQTGSNELLTFNYSLQTSNGSAPLTRGHPRSWYILQSIKTTNQKVIYSPYIAHNNQSLDYKKVTYSPYIDHNQPISRLELYVCDSYVIPLDREIVWNH